jgi:hypothetical protein
MNALKVGPIDIIFHRTVRVKEGQISDLPPSLGSIGFYSVKEFRKTCPESWDNNAIFIPLHEREAIWLAFNNPGVPVALLVGAGGINALTGEKLGLTLEKENYLVAPPQPWLDGWKGEDGTVYQFVATEHKKGEGLTVSEQLIGKESKTGGIGIAVFEAKNPRELEKVLKPKENVYGLCSFSAPAGGFEGYDDAITTSACCEDESTLDYDCEYETVACQPVLKGLTRGMTTKSVRRRGQHTNKAAEMGVGKGGKIFQKIYPDPTDYGIETWKAEPSAAVAVYLVNAVQFTEITGMPMPPLPKSAEDYIGTWYGLQDDKYEDVSGSDKFTGLKDVFGQQDEVEAAKKS